MVPIRSYVANSKSSASAMARTSFPCLSLRNSPSELRSLSAFHCAGLCDAVSIMPPHAFMPVTATSVVGVEASPMFTTSNPIPVRVAHTRLSTIGPETRASRPTTIRFDAHSELLRINAAYAAVNLTTSRGLRPSPGRPPMVPRIPEIDLISDIWKTVKLYLYS